MRSVVPDQISRTDCHSCASGSGFRASYCDECQRWTIHADRYHVLLGAGLALAATVVVGVAIIQPELVPPLMAGAAALAHRAIRSLA